MRNCADHEHKAHEHEARRVIDLPGHHGDAADRDGNEGEKVETQEA